MLDRLVDFLLNFIEDFIPLVIIKEYDRAVHFRGGKFLKIVNPGICWKLPFIDKVEVRTVVTTTLSIPTQSLTTKDGKQVVVKSVVKYDVESIKDLVLEVYDPVDAISDSTQAIIKEQIANRTWEEVVDSETDNIITKKVRLEVKKWGINIKKVTLTDIGVIKSLRLFNEVSNIANG